MELSLLLELNLSPQAISPDEMEIPPSNYNRIKRGSMKTTSVILFSFVFLFFADITLGESEDIWGTWVTTKKPKGDSLHVSQKRVFTSGGEIKFYFYESSQSPEFEGTYVVAEKWTDAGKNTWYKIKATGKSLRYGDKAGWYMLTRISDSGKTLEYVYHPLEYHKKLDPDHPSYRILYRK